jgi:hypothetical protein
VTDTVPVPEFDLGSARGRRPKELIFTIVRSLTEDDLGALQAPSALGSAPIPIQALRASHHQLAQLLAQGRPDTEISLITGYSASRISILKSDPTFSELLASYRNVREKVFVDTLERMKVLGLSTLDELQERLESAPEKWSNRELMEMAELMLKPQFPTAGSGFGAGPGAASGGVPPVTVAVQFIKSETPQLTIEHEAPAKSRAKGP